MEASTNHLYGTDSDLDPLPWKQRLQICIGVARGLHYLHAGVKHCIIHRGVKSSNILLDEKGEAKLTDLGWSKMGPPSLSKALIRIGNLGYSRICLPSIGEIWLNWALKCKREGTINQIIDPYLTGKIAPECFKIYMDIATSCVRTQGTQRPTIGEVEVALEHALELQESLDMDPGIGGAHQYMYPILEYTPDFPPEEEDYIWFFDIPTSARSSLDTTTPIDQ
uniref:Protein kinase domain-containing protein n=1 Tax=Fagus sylvatica TaxID=28930 RepID=A0A2N9H4N1_FAGSY